MSYENLVLDQDNNFHPISFIILMTCLLDEVWILSGEVTCQSLLRVKGLKEVCFFLNLKLLRIRNIIMWIE